VKVKTLLQIVRSPEVYRWGCARACIGEVGRLLSGLCCRVSRRGRHIIYVHINLAPEDPIRRHNKRKPFCCKSILSRKQTELILLRVWHVSFPTCDVYFPTPTYVPNHNPTKRFCCITIPHRTCPRMITFRCYVSTTVPLDLAFTHFFFGTDILHARIKLTHPN